MPPPAPARAAATVRPTAETIVATDNYYPADMAESPAISGVRRRRGRVAILAGSLALLVTVVTAGLIARIGDDRDDASSTTSGIVIVPTTGAPTANGVPTGVPLPSNPVTTAALATPPIRDGVPVITSQEAETFVRDYYDAVATRNYETSWSQPAPEFQSGMARSYDYYVNFWDQNDIEIDDVDVVDADQSRMIVNVQIRWNGNSTVETNQFTLRPTTNGDLLIAGQTAVDN